MVNESNNSSYTYESDDSVTLGKVSNYVSAFKTDREIKIETKDNSPVLPSEYSEAKERDIYYYYFTKFKQNLDNQEDVAKEITRRMNRLYLKNFTAAEVFSKFQFYLKDFDETLSTAATTKEVLQENPKEDLNSKKSPLLVERSYPFKKDTESLKNDKSELCNLINCSHLSFTLKGDSYRLGCGRGERVCTLEADMSPTDNMMFELFKEQLGDEVKARKLVILSRSIQRVPPKEDILEVTPNITKALVLYGAAPRKRGRPRKAIPL